MIRRVALRRFKRFADFELVLPGHVVLAGPNNTGKTTVLQAIAAWSLALDRWKQLNDFQRHGGRYTYAPIARQAFSAVPLRTFDLLWRERDYRGSVEIEVQSATEGWTVVMELIADSATTEERAHLIESLRLLSHADIMLALGAPGVLYLEDYTDLAILRAWARVLDHPARDLLTTRLFWKRTVVEPRPGAPGVRARDHYDALRLVRDDLPALELVDGDARPEIQSTDITGRGFQRLRWRRYEIESYLIHPDVLARFVEQTVGAAAAPHLADLRRHLEENYAPAILRDPLGDHAFLETTKARTRLLPPALSAAGLPGLPYTRYHEIAAVMRPDEIHPEVLEKLDGIMRAFGL